MIPTITIRDKRYEANKPKARIWRELCRFDEEKKNLPAEKFVDALPVGMEL